jgi:hypothetical protein
MANLFGKYKRRRAAPQKSGAAVAGRPVKCSAYYANPRVPRQVFRQIAQKSVL